MYPPVGLEPVLSPGGFWTDTLMADLFERYPRVEPRIKDVDEDVEQEDRTRDHQRTRLYDGEIALQYAVHHGFADAGPAEDGFDHDRAAQNAGELFSAHG